MSEKIKLFVSIAGIVLLFAIAAAGYNYLSKKYAPVTVLPNSDSNAFQDSTNTYDNEDIEDKNQTVLQKAPEFYVYDKDGNKINFSKMVGKPIIINFWATWCGPCKMEMPHFQKAYKEFSDKIEFMMINPTDGINDTLGNVEKFLSETGYTFPVYYDKDSVAVSVYGVSGFPTTFFVDKDGNLLGYYPGTMSKETLYACIDMVLGKTS